MNSKILANRMGYIYLGLCMTGVAILITIVYLQLFTDYGPQGPEIAYTTEAIEAHRGDILAWDGHVLATSVPYYKIRMDCVAPKDSVFERHVAALADALSRFFKDKKPAAYEKELREARKQRKRYKPLGNRDINQMELAKVKQFPIFSLGGYKGGFIAEQRNKRTNPYKRLAFRTIGYLNREGVGVGIESSYDFYLKGISGKQMLQRLTGGEWMPVSSTPMIMPQDGLDVVSTLDVGIQQATETALREQLALNDIFEGGCVVVMEVKTGAVRAIVNMKKRKDGTYDEAYNYAIGFATNPGSTFKLITLVALLEDGKARLSDSIATGNGRWSYATHTFTDVTHGGYGTVSLLKAFEKSSNVGFAKMAVERYGASEQEEKKYVNRVLNMKLGENLNVELLGEGRAYIPYPGTTGWSKLSLPQMAMGYEVQVTPMHTLTFYNAIANSGKMVKPYFIEELKRHGQTVKKMGGEVISNAICSKTTVKEAHKALRGVVTDGTAKNIFKDAPYAVSGKTGTAQMYLEFAHGYTSNGLRRHQASFAGFFPSEHPQFSMIVVLYTNLTAANFYGGSWAAPVFRKVSDYIYINHPYWAPPVDSRSHDKLLAQKAADSLHRQQMRADRVLEAMHRADTLMPSLVGMNLQDALYVLENKGLQVNYQGYGRIRKQNPEAGSPLTSNTIIDLELDYK